MRLYELALTVPWQITSDALEAMLSIAAREPLDEEEIARRMHGPMSLALRDRQRRDDSKRMQMRDGVAIIPIDGPIYRYADFFTQVSGGVTTDQLARDFQRALDDPAVRAILFTIDSPGGEATGISELADAIYAGRNKKRIVAYVEGFGASAAYHIASAADLVVVDDDALVGSIGTIMGVPDPAKRVTRSIEFVSSQSPKKRPDPTSDEGSAYLQQLVDDMTEVFIAKVARNRSRTRDQILAIEGGILVGQQAIDAGLADRLGSEEGTIRALIEQEAPAQPIGVRSRTPVFQFHEEDSRMKLSEIFGGFIRAARQEGIPIEADEAPATTTEVEQPPPVTRPPVASAQATVADSRDQRLADLERQIAEQRRQQIETVATAFADGAVRNRQALPAEREQLIGLYVQAATDDDRDGGHRATTVEQLIAARPQHNLVTEAVKVGEGGVLESGVQEGVTFARRQQLLGMTPLGQAALTTRKHTSAA